MDKAEISSNIRNITAVTLFFIDFIFLFLAFFLNKDLMQEDLCSKAGFLHSNYLKQSRKFDL